MSSEKRTRESRWRTYGLISLLFGVSVLAWVFSYRLAIEAFSIPIPKNTDVTALLFGTSSLALVVLSILLGIVAIFGWSAIRSVLEDRVEAGFRAQREKLEAEVDRFKRQAEDTLTSKTELLEAQLRGRADNVTGYLTGRASYDHLTLEVLNQESLADAVSFCERAWQSLKQVGGAPEFGALNNYVFFSCLVQKGVVGSEIVNHARRLRSAALDHKSHQLLLTACRALLQYSPDSAERAEAKKLLVDLVESDVLEAYKREARVHLASFGEHE